MLTFLRQEIQLFVLILFWVLASAFVPVLVYGLLPLSILIFRHREHFPEILFGFIMVLVLSDAHKDIHALNAFKNAKNVYIVFMSLLFLNDSGRYLPLAKVFTLFLPFSIYSIFPLVFSPSLIISVQKTLSYSLLILVVPNYVLYSFRTQGWPFMRNLMLFLMSVLIIGLYFRLGPDGFVNGRFRGIFGNPNGLGLYCYLTAILFAVMNSINPKLFRYWEKWIIYGALLYFLISSGSRASLIALGIMFIFQRFFSGSVFVGFMALLLFIGLFEYMYSNLEGIVAFLGAEEYFRFDTLESGSGRYFAWAFAWEQLQAYIVFGGGFGTDENVMRGFYEYLESMGHQGGVHNSYLSLWFDVGIVGLVIYMRSLFLVFIKASRFAPMSMAVLFSVLFSVTYESWLVGSLNPFTILFVISMTLLSEEEIVLADPEFQGSDNVLNAEAENAVPQVLPGYKPSI